MVTAIESQLGHSGVIVITELPFLQRRVDIVALQPSDSRIIAVEAKVKNWGDAVRQAVPCLLFADEVYIALPQEFSHRVRHDVIEQYGIGLIQVNSQVEVLIPPVRSPYCTPYYRQWVMSMIMSFYRGTKRVHNAPQ